MTMQSIEIQLVQQNTEQVNSQQSVTPKSRLQDLLAPLHLLDKRLQQSIEVRQVLLGTSFESYLLGSTAPGCSPATAIAGNSPLAQLQQSFGLSDFEVEVVLMAIAPELDRRYERLYAQLQPNACRKPTPLLSLDVLCRSTTEKDMMRSAFTATAPLIRLGLIHLKANGSFSLSSTISRHLLGQPMSPQVTAYCQLSRPKETGYVTNSPLLPDLLCRLREGSLPKALTLNFSGQGSKEAGARAIAAATKQPLLTVNLDAFLEGKGLSNTEINYKVQQVLLQGRLCNAVLYLSWAEEESHSKDFAAFQSQWFAPAHSHLRQRQSTVVKAFLDRVPTYTGTVIFSGQSLSSPAANSCKGLITVPFTAPCAALSGIGLAGNYLPGAYSAFNSSWQNTKRTAPKPLSETEWFRQKATGAVLGIG
ncbi:MAG: hypothetical protein ACFB0D_19345 [Phormidesmis sp.]